MKKVALTLAITSLVLLFGACEKSDLPSDYEIEGVYFGSITNLDIQNSQADDEVLEDATAEIIKIGNSMIEVHLYNAEIDTTFMLNYFGHMDNVKVCLTGDDFENFYGYQLREDHISRGMMGHLNNNETEWMHHLNDEHQEGEEHYGEFNMTNHTFHYPFKKMEGAVFQDLVFEGRKF